MARKIIYASILGFVLLFSQSALGEQTSKRKWFSGVGSASGSDFAAMRTEALNSARKDALNKCGIVLRSLSLLKEESINQNSNDLYTQFTESSTRGLILEERNVVIGEPVRISPVSEKTNVVYRVDAKLEALVALQNISPDPDFKVEIKAEKDMYRENQPVILKIRTTKTGYLTLFHVQGDSLSVLFPNALSKENQIKANLTFVFPPSGSYDLELAVIPGQQKSNETFMAVVTKEDAPFPNIEELKVEKGALKTSRNLLTTYTNWLYKIPTDQRTSDILVLKVTK
jgi:hypothetical protein